MYQATGAFARIDQILPLIHILSSIFFIAIQVACFSTIRSYMDKTMQHKEFQKIIEIFKNYEKKFIFLIVISSLSGFVISQIGHFKFADPMIEGVIATKLAIAAFIMLNFVYMHYKMYQLKISLEKDEIMEANEYLIIVIRYFLTLNIVISSIAVYLGIAIKGF